MQRADVVHDCDQCKDRGSHEHDQHVTDPAVRSGDVVAERLHHFRRELDRLIMNLGQPPLGGGVIEDELLGRGFTSSGKECGEGLVSEAVGLGQICFHLVFLPAKFRRAPY